MVGEERQGRHREPVVSEEATAAEGTVLEGPEGVRYATEESRVSKRVSASMAQIIINLEPITSPLAQE